MEISKKEVEALLKNEIEDSLFAQALSYAKLKQKYIFSIDQRLVVMQNWYLIQLTAEYTVSLSFSHFTMDVCKMLHNMEKEHSTNCQSALSE